MTLLSSNTMILRAASPPWRLTLVLVIACAQVATAQSTLRIKGSQKAQPSESTEKAASTLVPVRSEILVAARPQRHASPPRLLERITQDIHAALSRQAAAERTGLETYQPASGLQTEPKMATATRPERIAAPLIPPAAMTASIVAPQAKSQVGADAAARLDLSEPLAALGRDAATDKNPIPAPAVQPTRNDPPELPFASAATHSPAAEEVSPSTKLHDIVKNDAVAIASTEAAAELADIIPTEVKPPARSEIFVVTPPPPELPSRYSFAPEVQNAPPAVSQPMVKADRKPAVTPHPTLTPADLVAALAADTGVGAGTDDKTLSSPLVMEEFTFTDYSQALSATCFEADPAWGNTPVTDAAHSPTCETCLPRPGCAYNAGQSGAPSLCGVDCGRYGAPCCSTWADSHCIPWSVFGPGEYVGPARSQHVSTYFLRVNDLVTLTYITSRRKNAESYRIGVGDRLRIEWLRSATSSDASLDREVLVQPDGTITGPLVGEVSAAGKTVKDFTNEITDLYSKFQREPQITVTPLTVNIGQEDIIKAVTSQSRSAGQALDLRVTPEGTIQAPGVGSVYAQGLTLDELQSELEARYAATFGQGLLVTPSLTERATSYVFVGGEVRGPGRYTLEGPTTVMQAITLAGGWNVGGNVRQVVVFRRDENWCLKATKIDVRQPLYGDDPCPVNDVWLRENDLVIVPKQRILCAADVINLYFTRGVYAVFPITFVKDFSAGSIVPIP